MFSIYPMGSSSWNKYVNRGSSPSSRGTHAFVRGHDGRQVGLDLSHPHSFSDPTVYSLLCFSISREDVEHCGRYRRPGGRVLFLWIIQLVYSRRFADDCKGTSICTDVSRNSVCDAPGNYDFKSPKVIASATSCFAFINR